MSLSEPSAGPAGTDPTSPASGPGASVHAADRQEAARWLPLLAAGVTVLLWASAFVAIRHVGRDLSAGALSLGRLLVGSVALGAFLLVSRVRGQHRDRAWRRPTRHEWLVLLLIGVLWFGVYNVALNAAEQRLDAGTAAMLINVGPLLIGLLAGLTLGEGFPRPLVLGSLVGFTGVLVIGTATSSGANAQLSGVLLCLLAAVAYAVGVVAQKPLLGRLSALQVTWVSCTVGAVACLPFLPRLLDELPDARTSTLWWVGYLGLFPTAVAFSTWAYALSRTSAGRMGATTYLVPPLTILLAWLFLGETPAAFAFAGGALCLVGVALARRRS